MAARIFTDQEDSFPLSPEKVLEFLSPFPVATVLYLQHAIHHQATKVCIYACRGMDFDMTYTVCIRMNLSTPSWPLITLMTWWSYLVRAMHHNVWRWPGKDCWHFLSRRNITMPLSYWAKFMTQNCTESVPSSMGVWVCPGHITRAQLCYICTHLQMEEHEKALTLLAHKLKDFTQAEEYCCLYSQVHSKDDCSIVSVHMLELTRTAADCTSKTCFNCFWVCTYNQGTSATTLWSDRLCLSSIPMEQHLMQHRFKAHHLCVCSSSHTCIYRFWNCYLPTGL